MSGSARGPLLRSVLVLAGLLAVGGLAGLLSLWVAMLAGLPLVGIAGWQLVRWLGAPERWPGPVLRRGVDTDAAHWLVDVPPRQIGSARALAAGLAAHPAAATFFLPPEAADLARRLVDHGHGVGWLGVPTAEDIARADRLPLWRPRGRLTTRAEHARAAALGLSAVAPTVRLPDAPSGLQPVATDLVLVPVTLRSALLEAWLEDHARRAIVLRVLRRE